MPLLVTVALNLNDDVTLRDLRKFVEHAEKIGADPDTDVRKHDDNGDLVELEAIGPMTEDAPAE